MADDEKGASGDLYCCTSMQACTAASSLQCRTVADLWGFGRACAGGGVTRGGVALVGAVGVDVAANGTINRLPGGQGDEGLDVQEVEVPVAVVLKPDVVLARA